MPSPISAADSPCLPHFQSKLGGVVNSKLERAVGPLSECKTNALRAIRATLFGYPHQTLRFDGRTAQQARLLPASCETFICHNHQLSVIATAFEIANE
jgi:hypothetical protein